MTTNVAATILTSSGRRISPLTAWRAERSKVRTSWFVSGAVILGIFAQFLGVWNYTTNQSIFQEQGATWLAIWVQGAILVTSIFLPLLYAVVLAHTGSLEYQTRGWQRLASVDRVVPAVIGKVLVALELALVGMAVYLVAALTTGLILGFDPSQLGPYLARTLCGAMGAWTVGTMTMLLSTWFRTFATISAASLVAIMVGMGLTMAVPPFGAVYPFTLITAGLGARDPGGFDSPGSMLGTAIVCLIWVALSAVVTISRVRRREW